MKPRVNDCGYRSTLQGEKKKKAARKSVTPSILHSVQFRFSQKWNQRQTFKNTRPSLLNVPIYLTLLDPTQTCEAGAERPYPDPPYQRTNPANLSLSRGL